MSTTYPYDMAFPALDGRKRAAILKAAATLGLTVTASEGVTFLVTVPSPRSAFQFGRLSRQFANEAGAPLDPVDTPTPKAGDAT